jgi:hypothetical protein
MSRPAAANPLVLYDPSSPTAPNADLKSSTTAQAPQTTPQTCGLTTPCTDLNTAAGAQYIKPFASGVEYGLSGVATAGVSNHGEGGSLGVLGWIKPTDDSTLYVGLSVGTSRWNGQKVTLVPVPSHP